MIKKILVANRGEIAVRVMRSCREMEITSIAIFSEADRTAKHVLYADEAYCVGPAASKESYLNIEKIIEVAKAAHADAIHPGYGFLSENATFARRCQEEGIIFIGPNPETMEAMGDKIAARIKMIEAGVPVVPGTQDNLKSVEEAIELCNKIGYPVMLKASMGGGGKGMRLIHSAEEVEEAYTTAKSESLSSFGDDTVYLEKFVEEPHHIEFQILGDKHGNVIHLCERECSVQRRNQKIVEETPSVFVTPELRKDMGEKAVAAAKAVNYIGAGTIEFLVDQNRGKSIQLIGQYYPSENIGKVRRYGGELSVTYQDRVSNFNYYISANWSCDQSKLLYMDEQYVPEEYLRQTGRPVGVMYGLVADGFFTSKEEIENSPVIEGFNNIQPGDIKYKDLNGDKVINEFDRTVIGGDKPYSYFGIDLGFEWKGLEFSMLWQGAYNRDYYLGDVTLTEGFQQNGQFYGQAYENMLGRWTPETAETATFPRLTAGGNNYNRGNGWNSSFWLRSGNYIRLKNISLGYNLPDSFCRNNLGGLRVKLFVNGQNLFTKSACDLVDPEVSFTSYPLQRCISTGINIRF